MFKEVLLGEAVSRHLMGEKVLALWEEEGEFGTLADLIRGFRFLIDEKEPPAVGEVAEDTHEEEVKEEPEEEPATSKKKVDHGRIVALYTARDPWSIEDIADDVKCTPQTVINHLKKEGLYK